MYYTLNKDKKMKSSFVFTKEFVKKLFQNNNQLFSILSSTTTAATTARTVQLVGYDDNDDDLSITSQITKNSSSACTITTSNSNDSSSCCVTNKKLPLLLKSCLKKTRTNTTTNNIRRRSSLLPGQDDTLHNITRSSRRISFYKLVKIHPIISSLVLLSKEEISNSNNNNNEDEDEEIKQLLWYQLDEYNEMKSNNQNLINDIKDGVLICNNKNQYSIRGLERHFFKTQPKDNNINNCMTIHHSVLLEEQEKQQSHRHGGVGCFYDDAIQRRIANIYKTMNERNVKDAIQRGAIDQEASNYY
jgi:hypothetical protein